MKRLIVLAFLGVLCIAAAPETSSRAPGPDTEPEGCCGPLHEEADRITAELADYVTEQMPGPSDDVTVETFSFVAGTTGQTAGVFGCAARAQSDAESVRIIDCNSGPDSANTVVFPGSVATTFGTHSDTSNLTMIREVCYLVEVRFINGRTPERHSGCSESVVVAR
jgi:hypothetical protein